MRQAHACGRPGHGSRWSEAAGGQRLPRGTAAWAPRAGRSGRLCRRARLPDAANGSGGRGARRARVPAGAATPAGDERRRRRPDDFAQQVPARGPAPAGPRGRCQRRAARRQGAAGRARRPRLGHVEPGTAEPAQAQADRACARRGRARHQWSADRWPGPASGPVRRLRRGQERVAGHDGPLHASRRGGGGPDRRARPRSEGIHRRDSWRRRPGALGRGGRAG